MSKWQLWYSEVTELWYVLEYRRDNNEPLCFGGFDSKIEAAETAMEFMMEDEG